MESPEAQEAPAAASGRQLTGGGARVVSIGIQSRRESGAAVLEVVGDVDMASSTALRNAAIRLLRDRSEPKLVINLGGVQYIDSSGVAVLIEVLREARRQKAKLRIACLNDGPRDVLQLTRLLDLFDVHTTEAEALEA